MRLFFSYTKRQRILLDFVQNRVLSTESPVGKSWNRNCPPLDMCWFTQITLIHSIYVFVCQNYLTTFLGLSLTNHYPNMFFGLYKLSQCISWFSQAILVKRLLYPNYFMFLSSACCNCKSLLWHEHVWIWPWMGLSGICSCHHGK